jgi:hypothetical protein
VVVLEGEKGMSAQKERGGGYLLAVPRIHQRQEVAQRGVLRWYHIQAQVHICTKGIKLVRKTIAIK